LTAFGDADVERVARAWLAIDPDPVTSAELENLLASGKGALEPHFSTRLQFGTAGLRGPMGVGPARMNRVVVRVAAAALAERLLDEDAAPLVAVGFDARHNSETFALDTARMLAGRGIRVLLSTEALPTPVLAYAVREVEASAGVMVTASHNPRSDNGYKVYWRGGAQIVDPIDVELAGIMAGLELPCEADLAPVGHRLIEPLDVDLRTAYCRSVAGLLSPAGPRSVRIVYTPLHGVGYGVTAEAFGMCGFPPLVVVGSQVDPDPDFPTAHSPNPEDHEALAPLLELAVESGANVALAHDPDADRLAVAVPQGGRWRVLSGDELGAVLAEYLLSRPVRGPRLVISTIVSSRLIERICQEHGAEHVRCLTGFKWVMQARREHPEHELVLGYEEALGYAMGDAVADKDGISAALVTAELVAELATSGRSVVDMLDDLERRHGVHATGLRSVSVSSDSSPLEALRAATPRRLAGSVVDSFVDLSTGHEGLPPTDAVRLELGDARLTVRPSGTEPKLKVYGEVITEPPSDLAAARREARERLDALLDALTAAVSSA
jgi:phosphomannomutase